jgi:nitrate reductase NapE component
MDNKQQTIDNKQQTTDANSVSVVSGQSSVVKFIAHLISYIFHPIFIPLYAVAFLVFIHPSYFSGFSMAAKKQTLLIVFINVVAFPLLAVVLLKAVGFIQSIFLKTQRDRIIPYMACGIFFFWAYLVFKNQTNYPLILSSFLLGVFLASSAALLANIYFKISMHATGVGGLLGIFLLIMKSNTMLMTWPLCIALAITGLVCTARLLISDHSTKEIYIGLIAGLLSQFVAAIVVM